MDRSATTPMNGFEKKNKGDIHSTCAGRWIGVLVAELKVSSRLGPWKNGVQVADHG